MTEFFRPEDIINRYLDNKIVGTCCQCRDFFQIDGNWVRIPHIPPSYANLSHGYCPECLETALLEVGDRKGKLGKKRDKHEKALDWIVRNPEHFGIDVISLEWIAKELQFGEVSGLDCEPDVTMLGVKSYVFEYKASAKHQNKAFEQIEKAKQCVRDEYGVTPQGIIVIGKNREFSFV